jgi:CRP-like cAMP-binding protein
MDALAAIVCNVSRFIDLTPEEELYFTSIVRTVKIRKRQFIVQPEFVCRYKSYVHEGAMRAYFVDADGQEHTIALAIEDHWISDFPSFIYQTPATLFVEALEDSVLVQVEYQAMERLLELYPRFDKFLRIFSQRALAAFQRRMLSNLSLSAEQRYDEFLREFPALAARVPQYVVASYLGISTEFISKIRNGKLRKDTTQDKR